MATVWRSMEAGCRTAAGTVYAGDTGQRVALRKSVCALSTAQGRSDELTVELRSLEGPREGHRADAERDRTQRFVAPSFPAQPPRNFVQQGRELGLERFATRGQQASVCVAPIAWREAIR